MHTPSTRPHHPPGMTRRALLHAGVEGEPDRLAPHLEGLHELSAHHLEGGLEQPLALALDHHVTVPVGVALGIYLVYLHYGRAHDDRS